MQHKYEIARAINFWTVDKNRNDGEKSEKWGEKMEREREEKGEITDKHVKNTYFFPLSRKVSNSTDILQHNAFRRCPMEQFVLIKWPPRMEIRHMIKKCISRY